MPIESLWNDHDAAGLEGPALCAYASRLIGADPRFVLWGGGNSSVKTVERGADGRETRVLWVKASGFDMKSIGPEGFTPLRLDELLSLRSRGSMSDREMVAFQKRCSLDPSAARPSIETLLHAWVDAPHVYHTHADNVAGFTCTPHSRERTRKAFGPGVLWVPYSRPGFVLSRVGAAAVASSPRAWGLVLDKHGALTWGKTAREAYESMVRLVREAGRDVRLPGDKPELARRRPPSAGGHAAVRAKAAELLAKLRRELAPMAVRWNGSREVLEFLAQPGAPALTRRGPFTMEHALRVKAKPLVWRGGGEASLKAALAAYRRWYALYFDRYAPPGTPRLDPDPRVVLVPSVGLFAAGRDERDATAAEEVAVHNLAVMARVGAFTRYSPLGGRDLAGIEFWELETYKHRLQAVPRRVPAEAAVP